jgi:hypothetical protein
VTLAADWVTISALATAAGTLVLALATFASVRSAQRAARVAERSLLAGLRPLLLPSKLDDAPQKIGFVDDKWFLAEGGRGIAEADDSAVYLGIALRNVGSGIAVLHGWHFHSVEELARVMDEHREPSAFTRLTRDLYVPVGDVGFWQGAFRDPATPEFAEAHEAVAARKVLILDLLYGDHEGGQRVITRFALRPWTATAGPPLPPGTGTSTAPTRVSATSRCRRPRRRSQSPCRACAAGRSTTLGSGRR